MKTRFALALTPVSVLSLLAVACLSLLVPSIVRGQDFTGLYGKVADPNSAMIPHANVKATEESTGFVSTAKSNEMGDYELRGLLAGTYTLEVEQPGFSKFVNRGVIVYARQPRRVDVRLEIGSVQQSVTVEAEGFRITADAATTTYKLGQRETQYVIHEGVGGPVGSILYMATHNMPGTAIAGNGFGTNNAVHGGHANNIVTEQDGINVYGHGNFRAPAESVREIDVVALVASAEYPTQTTIVSVAPTGTNRLHGEAFVQLRDDALNAKNESQKLAPGPRKALWLENYAAGGPVYIPKIYDGRNKTFFHFLYQPESAPAIEYPRAVFPTSAMRAGNLSQALTPGKVLVDPYTGQPFPNNTIPASRIDPIAQNILKRVPSPSIGDFYGDNFTSPSTNSSKDSWMQLRFDHQISQNNVVSVTYYRFQASTANQWFGAPLTNATAINQTRAVSVQDSHTFTPRLVNEAKFAFNSQASVNTGGLLKGSDLLKEFGIADLGGRTPPDQVGTPFFGFQLLGYRLGGNAGGVASTQNIFGTTATSSNRSVPRLFTFKDTLSYGRGKHLFKAGLDINWERPFYLTVPQQSWGNWNFTGSFTGNEFGDFLLGLPFNTSIAVVRPQTQISEVNWGFFVEDTWKITPNFTLTPGVRFQHYGPPIDLNGLYYNFDFAKKQVVVPDEKALAAVVGAWPKNTIPVVTAAQAGYPSGLVDFKSLMVEPRLGLAWKVSPKFVVRMGYGVFHVPYGGQGGVSDLLSGRSAGPFQLTESFGPNQIVNGKPLFSLAQGFPAPGSGQIPLQTVQGIPLGTRSNNWPDDQQWSATLERELFYGFVGRVSYVGGKGTHWPYVRNLNQAQPSAVPYTQRPVSEKTPFGPQYASVLLQDLGGNSTYHGVEMELTRQFSRGLYFRGWYEYRKDLSDVQDGNYGTEQGSPIENPYNRVREKGEATGFTPIRGQFQLVYDLPVGRGQKFQSSLPTALNHILGNWTVATRYETYSRYANDAVFSGADPANVGASGGRASVVPGCDPLINQGTPGYMWNRNCFAVPANGNWGTSSRGTIYGPYVWETYLNLFKKWHLTSKESGPYMQLNASIRNIFNHRNSSSSAPLSNNIASPKFGYFAPDTYDARKIWLRLMVGF